MSKTILDVTSKIGSGATPRGGENTYKAKGISLIRSQNVLDFTFTYNGLAYIDKKQAKTLDNVDVKKGDILLNITGDSIARCCIVPNDVLPARVNQHVSILRANGVNNYYLMYYLQYLKPYLLKICGVGGTRNALTKEMIENLPFQQLKKEDDIANILFVLDQKISLNNRIISKLEAMAKTIYDYWFVQFDFPNAQGKPYRQSGGDMEYNDTLKREIPKGWRVEKLPEHCDVVDCLHSKKPEIVFENENEYLLQLENLIDFGLIDITNKYHVSSDMYKLWTSRIEVQDGDLVITNAGRIGAVSRIPKTIRAGIGRNMTAIRAINIPKMFLYYFITSRDVSAQIKSNTDIGSFFGSLNVKGIKELVFTLPPIEENRILEQFEKQAEPIRRKIEACSFENLQLTRLRDWLLPILMNGQATVVDRDESLQNSLHKKNNNFDTINEYDK